MGREMKMRARYALLLAFATLFGLCLIYGNAFFKSHRQPPLPAYDHMDWSPVSPVRRVASADSCSMSKCFDFTRCMDRDLKVYVYPETQHTGDDPGGVSDAYRKILEAVRGSAFYTANASEACLFVLSIDTTSRDKKSDNFVRNVPSLIDALSQDVWNGGQNHVIFTLYHGTYPDYADENLGFDTGKAIVARASAGAQSFRDGFDISLPLFHTEHPLRDIIDRSFALRDRDPYLVSFKGKRYVYGIGSETRDSLHHLHSPTRTPMLTTCRHNNDWQAYQDERCEADNEEYDKDKWNYEEMMINSTFCLTPRGRRLGSFRFLEALRVGCIPVVLSDDWRLPFDEIIEWTAAVVRIAEKNVLLVTDILSTYPRSKILKMKQRARLLYHRHFSSVEKIALDTLQLVWERVQQTRGHESPLYNTLLPFDTTWNSNVSHPRPLVAVISASDRTSSRLQHTVQQLQQLPGLSRVVIMWPVHRGPLPEGADFGLPSTVGVRLLNVERQAELPLMKISRLIEDEMEVDAMKGMDEDEKRRRLDLKNAAVLFVNDRRPEKETQLTRLLQIFEKRPTTIVTVEGVDYSMGGATVSSAVANVALLHTAVVHSGYLNLLRSFMPTHIVAACPTAVLSTLISSYSLSPPTLVNTIVQSGQTHHTPQANLANLTQCLDVIGLRYQPLGIPLLSGSAHMAVL